jgi:hypothetical protein
MDVRGAWCGVGRTPAGGIRAVRHAPRREMPNLEDPYSDDGFDDFPDVDGWGFGST